MKSEVSSKDVFEKSAISVEIVNLKKLISEKSLPRDYWDFVAEDSQQEEAFSSFSRKIVTHAQVQEYTGMKVQPYKAIVGECIFSSKLNPPVERGMQTRALHTTHGLWFRCLRLCDLIVVLLEFDSMPRDDPIIERIPRRSLKKRNITPSKNELPHIGSNVAFEENMISRFNIGIARRTRDG
ncbi:hypothetical protein Tco_1471134 [Tanacetum coccineum]